MQATVSSPIRASYINMLMQIDDIEKMDVIVMLVNSLKSSTGNKQMVSAKQFYGIWGDDGMTTKEFVDEIKAARSFHQDIVEL